MTRFAPPALPFAPPSPVARRSSAEVFLETLQQRVYASVGQTAEDHQRREWLGRLAVLPVRLQQKAAELAPDEFTRYCQAVAATLARDEAAPRPTAFERPHQYAILREIKDRVEQAAERLALQVPVSPVLGTLPTRLLEPLMLPVPASDEVVIVVDGGLLTYAHTLAGSLALAAPFELVEPEAFVPARPPAGLDSRIDPTGEASRQFIDLVLAVAASGPAAAPAGHVDAATEPMAAALCDAMETFLIGREYGRLLHGDQLGTPVERRWVHGQPCEAFRWTRAQELEADVVGLALVVSAAIDRGESARLAWWGVDTLLASFDLLERVVRCFSRAQFVPLSALGPTVFEARRRALAQAMAHWDPARRAIAFSDALAPVVDTLIDRLEIVLQDLLVGHGLAQ